MFKPYIFRKCPNCGKFDLYKFVEADAGSFIFDHVREFDTFSDYLVFINITYPAAIKKAHKRKLR